MVSIGPSYHQAVRGRMSAADLMTVTRLGLDAVPWSFRLLSVFPRVP
jgi:hypothetical protein